MNRSKVLKYIKKDLNNPNKYYLIEPHLLYLSDEQANNYLSIMNDKSYSSTFHNTTIKIIHNNLENIFNESKTVSLVDLGPGYPDKALPMVKYLKNKNINVNYYPVDINSKFLDITEKVIKDYVFNITKINSLFEECTKLLPKEIYKTKIYTMIGLTFMNFEPKKILSIIKTINKNSGSVLLASELITSNNTIDNILKTYNTKKIHELIFSPLSLLKVSKNSITPEIVFENSRVEMGLIINKTNSTLESVGIKESNKVLTAISYRYTKKQFEQLLSLYFKSTKVFYEDNTALAVCSF